MVNVNEKQLEEEHCKGVTIIKTRGYNMISQSNKIDFSDLDLFNMNRGAFSHWDCKNVIFNAEKITDINFNPGAHVSYPAGVIKYSDKEYILKHMNFLGYASFEYKTLVRFDRTKEDREQRGLCTHYTNNGDDIRKTFDSIWNDSSIIEEANQYV